MSNLPSGTVTFLFTDIEGSTKLAQAHPDDWGALQTRHHAILQSAMDAYNGYVFQIIGDAFCVAFHTANDGLYAAIETQRKLQSEDWGMDPIQVRIGIHTGSAELQEIGDYRGYLTLSHVQRLMSAGHGGQILISQATQDLVRDDMAKGITLQDMGLHRLKDLAQPERIFQVNVPELPSEFPVLKTLNAQLNNLPVQLTPFVGRNREITAVLGLLRNADVHLVTLTGPGGTGKTRLSLQVGANLLDEYEHGVWFVELASITNPNLFLPTVASTLKVKEAAGKSISDVINEYLANKQLLLILDNFEQIVSAAPDISGLLTAAPNIKVLVSSREVLRLRGEHGYSVPPLGLPESKRKQTAAVLAQYEAIALFTQHARAVNPSFGLNDDNANIIAEICMKLDGLPLAIELAAARSRLLKPAVMLEKLKNKLDTLTGGARDLPRRQQTIRGAIDWSYDLLEEAERNLFARLGIFVGGWTLESAEAVCGSGLDALSGIESLLDKSLIRQYEGVSGETRFIMLETIREYAHEKLSQNGELESIQQAHADFMGQFLQKVKDAQGKPEEGEWFAKVDDDLDNVRSVVEWALARQKPTYVFALNGTYQYWFQRSKMQEPLSWLEQALEMNGGTARERASTFSNMGGFSHELGIDEQARKYHESSLALFRELDDANGISGALNNLANIAKNLDKDYEKAQKLYEESLSIRLDRNSWSASMILNNLGSLARIRGEYATALKYYTQSLEICVNLGADTGIGYANYFLGLLALMQRKLDDALTHFENAHKANWLKSNPLVLRWVRCYEGYVQILQGNVHDARRILNDSIEAAFEHYLVSPNLSAAWIFFDGKARLELIDGHFERAAQFFGMAWVQREVGDFFLTEFERPEYEARIAEVRAGMDDAAFEAAFQKGQSMSIKNALQLALE